MNAPLGDTQEKLDAVRRWRDAAVADGWSQEAMYGPYEDVDRVARLRKDGWVAQVFMRVYDTGYIHANVTIWGPDNLQVTVPPIYSMEALVKNLRKCLNCGAEDVDVVSYSFAGRCCKACFPELARKTMSGNWAS